MLFFPRLYAFDPQVQNLALQNDHFFSTQVILFKNLTLHNEWFWNINFNNANDLWKMLLENPRERPGPYKNNIYRLNLLMG